MLARAGKIGSEAFYLKKVHIEIIAELSGDFKWPVIMDNDGEDSP